MLGKTDPKDAGWIECRFSDSGYVYDGWYRPLYFNNELQGYEVTRDLEGTVYVTDIAGKYTYGQLYTTTNKGEANE